ncbi:MAG: hypothetical protein IIB43_06920 [Candidatus Marinimicrobia bacterium]|nr:hypothetical protein [Candidatus Neomarinimicrobiota bacterium]
MSLEKATGYLVGAFLMLKGWDEAPQWMPNSSLRLADDVAKAAASLSQVFIQ